MTSIHSYTNATLTNQILPTLSHHHKNILAFSTICILLLAIIGLLVAVLFKSRKLSKQPVISNPFPSQYTTISTNPLNPRNSFSRSLDSMDNFLREDGSSNTSSPSSSSKSLTSFYQHSVNPFHSQFSLNPSTSQGLQHRHQQFVSSNSNWKELEFDYQSPASSSFSVTFPSLSSFQILPPSRSPPENYNYFTDRMFTSASLPPTPSSLTSSPHLPSNFTVDSLPPPLPLPVSFSSSTPSPPRGSSSFLPSSSTSSSSHTTFPSLTSSVLTPPSPQSHSQFPPPPQSPYSLPSPSPSLVSSLSFKDVSFALSRQNDYLASLPPPSPSPFSVSSSSKSMPSSSSSSHKFSRSSLSPHSPSPSASSSSSSTFSC